MNFDFKSNHIIPDVKIITARRFEDDRGFFSETFKKDLFEEHGIANLVQENYSYSKQGTIRGLHYQINPAPLGKLVFCLKGAILDIAVDIRQGSPTFGKSADVTLHAAATGTGLTKMVWVPEGFAHGFQVISEDAVVVYKQSGYYAPEHERSIVWNDPDLDIGWFDIKPILSKKDEEAKPFKELDSNFIWSK